jgi:hypothetical protein
MLLPVPFLICGAILHGSTLIGRIGIVHLLTISVLPMGLSMASAVGVSSYLIRSPWHYLLTTAYCIGLLYFWAAIVEAYDLNPFP